MVQQLEKVTPGRLKARQQEMTVTPDWQDAIRIMEREPGPVALDLETTGLSFNTDRIAVLAMYGQESNTAAIIHLRGQDPDPRLISWLSSPERSFITHNGTQFDIPYLARYDVAYRQPRWYDTLIGEQVIKATDRKDVRVNLKATLARRLKVDIPKDVSHETWMLPELDAQQMRYLADDIYYLPVLRQTQEEKAAEHPGNEYRNGVPDALSFEQTLAPIVSGMIMRGLPIDEQLLAGYLEAQLAAVPEHKTWLEDALGIKNLGHAPSVQAAIEARYGMALPNTRADTLHELTKADGPIAEVATRLLALRKGTKRGGMYGSEKFTQHIWRGKVYGNFWQTGTNTGRFSSSNPNLQQVPRDMRAVFRDPSGELAYVAADYSAIEVRCAAALYQDTELLKALESGDIHTTVAASLFGIPEEEVSKEQRRLAKAGSFNLTFGGGFKKLWLKARADGSEASYADIERFGQQFLSRFRGVDRARQNAYFRADQGRPVALTFPTGLRRVLIPGVDLMGTTILNNTVQATAAAGLKHALLLADERGLSQYLSAVVHDEIVATPPMAEAEEYAAALEQAMIDGMAEVTDAPVAVDAKGTRESWG